MKLNLSSRWVLPIAIGVLLVFLYYLESQILDYTKGAFVYPQDDAYIRMAIAKNLAFHGVWGLSAQEFVSASSSILYPIILAAFYKLFGSQLIISFIINLIAALILLVVIRRWLQRQGLSPFSQLMILLAVIILTPLPILIAIGMEHMLQMLFSFLFLYGFCEWLASNPSSDGKDRNLPWQVYLWGFLLTATRYEGLFVALVASLFLLKRRKWLPAISLGLICLLPGVIFGIYSVGQGSYFLPNSILIRSMPVPLNFDKIQKFITTDLVNKLLFPFPTRGGVATERILVVLPLVYWIFIGPIRQQRLYRSLLLFCMAITALHLIFANATLLYRYEAYLIVCALPIVGLLIAKYAKSVIPAKGGSARWVGVWTVIVLLLPIFMRGWQAYKDTGRSSLNMYERDYQVAKFLQQYYDRGTVVMDDFGVASFLSGGKKLDIYDGIGNMEVTRGKEEEYYRPVYQGFLTEKEKPVVAVINEKHYNPYVYTTWTRVVTWQTYNAMPFTQPDISFYAIRKSDTAALRRNLEAFESKLPPGVKVTYY